METAIHYRSLMPRSLCALLSRRAEMISAGAAGDALQPIERIIGTHVAAFRAQHDRRQFGGTPEWHGQTPLTAPNAIMWSTFYYHLNGRARVTCYPSGTGYKLDARVSRDPYPANPDGSGTVPKGYDHDQTVTQHPTLEAASEAFKRAMKEIEATLAAYPTPFDLELVTAADLDPVDSADLFTLSFIEERDMEVQARLCDLHGNFADNHMLWWDAGEIDQDLEKRARTDPSLHAELIREIVRAAEPAIGDVNELYNT